MRCSHTNGAAQEGGNGQRQLIAHAHKRTRGPPPCLLARAEHAGAPRSGARGADNDRRGGPSKGPRALSA
eukprot:8238591-Alexandrium_andersonii.AAC.1